jgi:hypothetical protein
MDIMNDRSRANENRPDRERKGQPWFDYSVVIAILALGIFVVLRPAAVYTPVSGNILYVLVGIMVALLLGRQGQATFKWKAQSFYVFVAGSAALVFIALLLLSWLSRPGLMVSVFHVYTEEGEEVPLEGTGMFSVELPGSGISVGSVVQGNTVVLLFPEQQPEVDVKVRHGGATYFGAVSYAGERQSKLVLGEHLRRKGSP